MAVPDDVGFNDTFIFMRFNPKTTLYYPQVNIHRQCRCGWNSEMHLPHLALVMKMTAHTGHLVRSLLTDLILCFPLSP